MTLKKPTTIKSVIGCTGYRGKRKTLKEMQAGVAKGAKKEMLPS